MAAERSEMKTVKAWAIVNKKGRLVYWGDSFGIFPTRRTLENAKQYYDNGDVVPCTITFDQPKKKAKRGKK